MGEPLLLAAKILQAIAAGPAKRYVHRRTFPIRVAWSAAGEARAQNIDVRVHAIAGWLRRDDTRELLVTGDVDGLEAAVANLALRVGGRDSRADAERLVEIVLQKTALAMDPREALHNTETRIRSDVRSEGERTRAALTERYPPAKQFEDDLRRLHPWRAASARSVHEYWPSMVEPVRLLAQAPSPAAVLAEWAAAHPRWLHDAPADVHAWLGHVANDYKANEAAVHFYLEAIDSGATPRDYYLARAALALDRDNSARSQELVDQTSGTEPLSAVLAAMYKHDYGSALSALTAWEPGDDNDTAIRVLLRAQVLSEQGLEDQAIDELCAAAEADLAASGPAVAAAIYLSKRATSGRSASPYRDFDWAFRFAIRARNARREWRGDSASAVVLAVGSIVLFGDIDRALLLTLPEPEGEATATEAANDDVGQERAVLLAISAPIAAAREALQRHSRPYTLALASGIIASRESDPGESTTQMLLAYTLADTDVERERTARLLAGMGTELPDLTDLATRRPDAVAAVRRLHSLLQDSGPSRLERLRAHRHDDPQIAIALAEEYGATGRKEEAARTFEEAGKHFNLPRLILQAGHGHLELGDPTTAIRMCEAAIAMGGAGWPGEFTARACMYDAFQAEGRLDDALQQARALVGLDPTDRSATWALIHVLVQLGQHESAWKALGVFGEPIEPRTAVEARRWVQLVIASPRAAALVSRTLEVIRAWSDDPALTDTFVGGLAAFLPTEGMSDTDRAAVSEVLHDLMTTKQSADPRVSSVLIQAGPVGRATIEAAAKSRHESLAELTHLVETGQVPVGMLAYGSSTVTDVLLRGYAGKVYAYQEKNAADRRTAVEAALDARCVIDLTAVFTLAVLDPSTSTDLRSRFASLQSTYAQFHDALNAQFAVSMKATSTIAWDPSTQQVKTNQISESDARALRERSERMVEMLRTSSIRTHRNITRLPDLADSQGALVWAAPADMAATLDLPFWCDDMILNEIATDAGVSTFGTVDLVRYLLDRDAWTPDLAAVTEAVLVHNRYIDLGFRPEVQRHAAELASWNAEGAAFSMTRPASWQDPAAAMRFIETAIDNADDPSAIQAWVEAAATGLTSNVEIDDANANLRALLRRLLDSMTLHVEHLPFVLRGIRARLRGDDRLEDPFEAIMREVHTGLIERHGYQVAQVLLLGLVVQASDSDKALAARIILTA